MSKLKVLNSCFRGGIVAILFNIGLSGVAYSQTIDGNSSEWLPLVSFTDVDGVDDESSPVTADITEFRVQPTSTALCVLMAWDDIFASGGTASRAAVDVDLTADGTSDYRVSVAASGNTDPGDLIEVLSCTGGCVASTTIVCADGGSPADDCTSATAAKGLDWTDPFTHVSGCNGTNCTTLDTFVEMCVPWSYLGGTSPADGQVVFLNFGSFPSGSGGAPKDSAGANGLACSN
ncbi:MAG: hypothetical protein JSU96_07460, partial [Acidobacteriota bacterium]